ncbi:MAG TPA: serine/threonine-protein kinase [Streptosporangiaceae bacterium]|nr:serine/threonine-protein kinase [Streptosporangiaceae bacterium]
MAWEPLDTDPAEVAGYRLRARLGAGGMGRVYLAFTPGGRPVAVKVIRPDLGDDPQFRARFRQEIAAARRVRGLFTAEVLDGDPDGTPPWLVTAYVAGPSLARAVADHGPVPAPTVLLLLAGVAEALQAIHGAGLVHRDLKPSNVLLAGDGPRVIDFGIARAAQATALTGTGMRVGSPQFMAPEQVRGAAVTPAADVFALGALACFAATGRAPFGEGEPAAVLYRVLHHEADLGGCPAPLREAIAACLVKDPAARPEPARIIEFCRRHAVGQTLEFTGSWLPPGVAADLSRHAPPPMPPAGLAGGALAGTLAGATRRQTLVQAGGPPPPARRASRPVLIAVAAVAALIVGLAGYGAVALAGRGGGQRGHATGLDSCLFGTWTGTAARYPLTEGSLTITFTGRGPTMIFRPDGTGVIEYGPRASLRALIGHGTWTTVYTGTVMSRYATRNGTLVASDVSAHASYTVLDGRSYNSGGPITAGAVRSQTERYQCSASTLRLSAPGGEWQELARTSASAGPSGS